MRASLLRSGTDLLLGKGETRRRRPLRPEGRSADRRSERIASDRDLRRESTDSESYNSACLPGAGFPDGRSLRERRRNTPPPLQRPPPSEQETRVQLFPNKTRYASSLTTRPVTFGRNDIKSFNLSWSTPDRRPERE
jgi:hypothetical protein